MPTSTSPSPLAISCTTTPSTAAVGAALATAARMSSRAATSAAGLSTPSTTPPTSDLWASAADRTLTATGHVRSVGAGASGPRAWVRATGTPRDWKRVRAPASSKGPSPSIAGGSTTAGGDGACQRMNAASASAQDSAVRNPARPAAARALSEASACGTMNPASGVA